MVKLKVSLKNYSVVLLSAGIGRRLGKIGKNKPKSIINKSQNGNFKTSRDFSIKRFKRIKYNRWL